MSIELKIKSKHLAVESKIIRIEELKLKKKAKWEREHQGHADNEETLTLLNSLANHRRYDVKNEARATFIARGFIQGKPYNCVEHGRKEEKEYEFNYYVVPRVLNMIKKYGDTSVTKTQLQEWLG